MKHGSTPARSTSARDPVNEESVVWDNRTISLIEGCLYGVMVACGESLMIPCGIRMGLPASQIALLATLPVGLGSSAQFIAPFLSPRWIARRHAVAILMLIQTLGLFLVALTPTLTFERLLLGGLLYWIGGSGANPIWTAWMIPRNPSEQMAMYHGRRNGVIAFVTFVVFVSGGWSLLHWESIHTFRYLFFLGALCRVASAVLILFHRDHTGFKEDAEPMPLREALRPKQGRVFALSLLAVLVLFRASAGFAAPHFAQYMLKDLKLTFFTYTFLVGSSFLGRTLLLQNWVRSSLTFGNKNTLLYSCFFLSAIPSMWLLSSNVTWLWIVEIISGGGWAGFELLTLLILSSLGLANWARYVGLLGMLTTLSAMATGYLGGVLLDRGVPISVIIHGSGVGRLLSTFLLILVLKRYAFDEVKVKRFVPLFFSTLSLRPSFSNIQAVFWRRRRT